MTRSAPAIGRSQRLWPALDIGGAHVSAALVDLATDRVLVEARSDESLDAGAAADVILDRIAGCASKIGQTPEMVWGVAIPGPFDYAVGIARFHGVAKFESLDGVDMRAGLMERIRPTPGDVRFLNDADAFGLGEWRAGAASGHERAVVITLGTGVGSAFLAAGSVVDDDPSVPPEGRLDLLAIDGRPLEDTVSRRALLTRYAKLADDVRADVDVRDIAERARAGDSVARRVFDDSMRALGEAIGPWLSAFHATALVVGGAIAGSWDIIAKPLRDGLRDADPALARRLAVLPSRRPRDAALIGAALQSAAGAPLSHPGDLTHPYASGSPTQPEPTIRDVAGRAGVSPMTVSRALRDDRRVAEKTRRRVLAAVDELGYRRNELARNLRLGRTSGLVGLVVTNLANPFYSQLALGVEAVAGEHGLKVVLGNTGEDVDRERRLVEELAARRVDGMIVVPAGGDHSHLSPARTGRIPIVLGARPPSKLALDCVLVDDFNGAREATARLIARGARRVGFLGLPPSAWTGSERYRGFCVALEDAGAPLDERYVRRAQRTIAAAEQAALELLGLTEPPDALFCANSRNTVGAFRAIRGMDSGTMLAGFDDFELADMLGLPLIVVAYDPEELGRQAARLLVDRMNHRGAEESSARRIVIPTTVVEYGPVETRIGAAR